MPMAIVKSKGESVFLALILAVVSVLVLGVGFIGAFIVALANGYVGMYLWDWFVTPLGVRPISFIEAAGLATLIGFWHPTPTSTTKSDGSKTSSTLVIELISLIVLRPLLTLLFGYILHQML